MKRTIMTQERIERIAKMALAHLRAERRFASKASEGPWYYVWLKPHWKLIAFPHPYGGDEGYEHVQLWESVVVDIITKHYGLDKEQADDLGMTVYGMPRGRVVWQGPSKEHHPRGRFIVYFGNDIPKAIGQVKFKREIMSKFGLLPIALDDKERVVFRGDEHETMNVFDKETIQSIIGEVPYK